MTQTVSFTFDDDELAAVAIKAIAEHLSKSKSGSVSLAVSANGEFADTAKDDSLEKKADSPVKQDVWIETQAMAYELGISVRTIHYYRQLKDSPFLADRHYKRRTPARKSAWIWNKKLTLKAWGATIFQ